ncbi:cytochrome P450 [Pleurotus eryngii]|uniref:Cytochrome P450 n=1 Tax=Pleurotus eryngii TaxID=5323 RepID=A0A9P5ZXU5_PLEER|nr:cytochrome P450 [Pleurotus eryngii]
MPTVSYGWLSAILLGTFAYILRQRSRGQRKQQCPPGPPTSWGGLKLKVELPKQYPWLTYAKWKGIYGDIVFLNIFRNPVLVLNSAEAAQDLLEKRSAIYSSRPVRTMQAELMGFGFLFSGLPYNAWYKQHRNMFHKHFQPKVVPEYHAIQLKHARILLRNLLHDHSNLDHHIRRTTAAIVLEISYGHHVADQGDEYVTLADKALFGVTQSGVFGTYMVDYVPLLKHVPAWMPGAEFKRNARKWRTLATQMLNRPFEMVKERMESGTAEGCMITTELESWFREGIDNDKSRGTVIKDVAATAYAAGSDTTLSTLATFFLAMVLYPSVQEKARDEIFKHIPCGERLPSFGDRGDGQLSYIDYVIWESLRWHPVVNISLAHYIEERNDEYRGYTIPKGTTVLGNIWAITHDAAVYPDPEKFDPERFVNTRVNEEQGINPIPEVVFGFGRRVCPGRFLALDTIWIVIASVLAVYRISKTVDDDGNEVEPNVEYTSGLFSRPKPFEFRLTPLSDGATTLIAQTVTDA